MRRHAHKISARQSVAEHFKHAADHDVAERLQIRERIRLQPHWSAVGERVGIDIVFNHSAPRFRSSSARTQRTGRMKRRSSENDAGHPRRGQHGPAFEPMPNA